MLKQVTKPDGETVTFKYDSLGRRVEKSSDSKIVKFVWDGNNPLHEWEENPEIKRSDSLVTWVFDEGTFTPSAKLTSQGNYSIISDHLGTPVEAYDSDGKKVWEQELDIYGRVRPRSVVRKWGQVVDDGLLDEHFIPFRYQGQYSDEEFDGTLYYNRHRYYSPELGQYITQDPIGLTGNNPTLYGYVSDPNIWTDPFGLWVWEPDTPKPSGWILPQNGTWSGEPGHSNFKPSDPGALGLKPGEIIPFSGGKPDFSKWSQGNYTVEGMNGNHTNDMSKIHKHMAEKNPQTFKNQTAAKNWLSKKGLTPHHAGGKSIQLIPSKLHGGVKHMGGAHELRNKGGCKPS